MENHKLLPCPFCGGEPTIRGTKTEWLENVLFGKRNEYKQESWWISCETVDCPAYHMMEYETREQAVEAWNTRKPMERIVQQLEEKSNDIPIQYENNYEQGFANGIDYAIDIVRKGGVDNATN